MSDRKTNAPSCSGRRSAHFEYPQCHILWKNIVLVFLLSCLLQRRRRKIKLKQNKCSQQISKKTLNCLNFLSYCIICCVDVQLQQTYVCNLRIKKKSITYVVGIWAVTQSVPSLNTPLPLYSIHNIISDPRTFTYSLSKGSKLS